MKVNFICKDKWSNRCERSDAEFTADIIYKKTENERFRVRTVIDASANDGSYELKFTLAYLGEYIFQMKLNNYPYDGQFAFRAESICLSDAPVLCPDAQTCKKDYLSCLNETEKCKTDKNEDGYKCDDGSCSGKWSDCAAK
jgi:hypothetical protein